MESLPLSSGASQSHHIFMLSCSRLAQIIGFLPNGSFSTKAGESARLEEAQPTKEPTDVAAPSFRKSLRSIMSASVGGGMLWSSVKCETRQHGELTQIKRHRGEKLRGGPKGR